MGILNKIRPKTSLKRENTSLMIMGLLFLLLGLAYLFIFPADFINYSFDFPGRGYVPTFIITCCGWALFSFRLINHYKLTNNKKFFKLISRIKFFGVKNLTTKAFLLLSTIFISLVISVFIFTNPIKRERIKEESNKNLKELIKKSEKLN
jgi:hypothetical protein